MLKVRKICYSTNHWYLIIIGEYNLNCWIVQFSQLELRTQFEKKTASQSVQTCLSGEYAFIWLLLQLWSHWWGAYFKVILYQVLHMKWLGLPVNCPLRRSGLQIWCTADYFCRMSLSISFISDNGKRDINLLLFHDYNFGQHRVLRKKWWVAKFSDIHCKSEEEWLVYFMSSNPSHFVHSLHTIQLILFSNSPVSSANVLLLFSVILDQQETKEDL